MLSTFPNLTAPWIYRNFEDLLINEHLPCRSAREVQLHLMARWISPKFFIILRLFLDHLKPYRPFPHYAPVNKHKEMRTRLGWTVSYKSLYFVHPSLELVPLFTGMRERSIGRWFRVYTCFVLTWDHGIMIIMVIMGSWSSWNHGLTAILTCLAMSIISAVRRFITSTVYVGAESICLIKPPYPFTIRLNWTTATAYYMAFLRIRLSWGKRSLCRVLM